MSEKEPSKDAKTTWAVLNIMRSKEWVTTAELSGPETGTEGTKRLRELKKLGYSYAKKRKPGSSQFLYHLITDEDRRAMALVPESVADTIADNITRPTTYGNRRRDPDPVSDPSPRIETPWVFWKSGLKGSFTARYGGHDLWVAPALGDQWVWRVIGVGPLQSGYADSEQDAKDAARRAMLRGR